MHYFIVQKENGSYHIIKVEEKLLKVFYKENKEVIIAQGKSLAAVLKAFELFPKK